MVKLDDIVREALADKNYSTLQHYPRYLMYALRAHRKINIDYSEEIKTIELPVSKRGTVKYPDDYIAYNKVAIKIGDRLWCLTRDNTITSHTPSKYEGNEPFYKEARDKIQPYRFYNYYSSSYNGGDGSGYLDYVDLRGYGYNQRGYFTTVDSCKEFQLSTEISAKKIILEYIAMNFSPDTETLVPIMAQDVYKEYIHWQDARFKSNVSISKVREEEREYFAELGNYNMRLSDLSYEGIMDVLARQTTLAING